MPKLVGKVVLHSFPYQFVFKLHFQYGRRRPFWIWLLTNSAAIFARVIGAKFFLNTSKSSNQVSNLTMLSVVTGPPDCTRLNTCDAGNEICVANGTFVISQSCLHWWKCNDFLTDYCPLTFSMLFYEHPF